MSDPMAVFPSNGHRHPHGIKREHDHDQVYDVSPKSTSANDNASDHQNAHQHKKKKNHHFRVQNGEGQKLKKKKQQNSKHSQKSQEDTLMSGGLGEMSAELGEQMILPGHKHANSSDGKKKKKKSKNQKTVHFEGHETARTETVQKNGNATSFQTSVLPVRSQNASLQPTSSPILPPTRPRSYSNNGQPPILPPASPSRMNLLHRPPMNSAPILPPISPFRNRRGSTGNAFSGPPPSFCEPAPLSKATQPTAFKDPKPRDDDWEFSSGKIRAIAGNLMEKDTQREENVAFSSNYIQSPMRQSQGINVAGVNFNIIELKHRGSSVLKQKGTGLQICSVAKGNVWVSLESENFRISKGGMWRVKDGEKCSVRNQDPQDTTLHITSIPSATALI